MRAAMISSAMVRSTCVLWMTLLFAACSLVPPYQRPVVAVPENFKEEAGWRPAAPADDTPRAQWWALFEDSQLDALQSRVQVSNQNIAAATAAYDQARALVRVQRSALFPVIDLQADASRAGSFGSNSVVTTTGTGNTGGTGTGTGTGIGNTVNNSSNASRNYSASIGASWEVDVFGRLRATVSQAGALAQASAADLANATLAAQGELALSYVQLRALDAQADLLAATIAAYERALKITSNQYAAGVVSQVDVLQAQTQLSNARASAVDLVRQRALQEHAIAVLVGENPSTFTLEKTAWMPRVPDVPAILPSALLERRPDVAAAERSVAAANDAVGIARAAFFPTFNLTGSAGVFSSSLSNLFEVDNSVWSLGASGLLTLLDFGARSAGVAQARAAYEQTVAQYRQTALTAFQQTEDQLAAAKILVIEERELAAATTAANKAEQLTLNQYLAGLVSYANVIVTQTVALSARQASVTAVLNRQTAAISLIQAIGGYWDAGEQPR